MGEEHHGAETTLNLGLGPARRLPVSPVAGNTKNNVDDFALKGEAPISQWRSRCFLSRMRQPAIAQRAAISVRSKSVGMTEPDPITEADGATVATMGNPPPEDKCAVYDTDKKEGEQKVDVDEKKESKETDVDGKEEGVGEKDINKRDGELEEDGEEMKEGEVEDDGEKKKEGEPEDQEKKKENEVEEKGDEKKEDEVEKNGNEMKENEVEENDDEREEDEVKEYGDEMKDEELEENGDERKECKETMDVEQEEDGHQNGAKELEDMDREKEDTDNVNTTESQDVKMVDVEYVKADDTEDVKMVDAEDIKGDEKGGETVEQEGSQHEMEIDVNKEGDGRTNEEKVVEDKEADASKKKSSRVKKASKLEGMDKGGETRAKKLLFSPVSSTERPVRQRKTVERLVEVIEKEPNREFQVEKGHGTPLKDIPNVAYKLARKKVADIKLIHQTLFGRKGKAVNFKSHILQFSGFIWHESDEKQRAKMKEKLDKYVKDMLLDLCDLFDLPVSRVNSRKEDLVTKLLDFLVAPHPTTDVALPKDQKSRKRKRMARGSASKSRGMPTKHSEKRTKGEETPTGKESSSQETEDDEDEKEDDLSEEENVHKHSEIETKEIKSVEVADEDENNDDDDVNEYGEKKLGKSKQEKKKSVKPRGSVAKENLKLNTSLKKNSLPTTTKRSAKRSISKCSMAEEENETSTKVFTSKKRNLDFPNKKSTPKSNRKDKATDKKMARGKTKRLEVEQPSKEDLRKKICQLLKEVDFSTATFTDILKQLAAYYKLDMTPRKASLKLMIQEELTKIAEEAEEEEDDEDEDDAEKERQISTRGQQGGGSSIRRRKVT
ncbi:hypothetical protein OPV22_024416 [Ensete ventricosum]|uniref:DEK-C domain-containing protein n=1 Tax=Ensete ventricosum TaxID=4639 RepID=A0AAV8QAQ4_ENSVE|nr:hypothetical protein OPV22_024416 [Ensete ventricosum]